MKARIKKTGEIVNLPSYTTITAGKIFECFAFLPSLNLSWMRTTKGNIYILQFAWLYWYIEVRQNRSTTKL